MDVPAVSSVRDEMLVQKGRILDILVEEIADVLFLRAATTRLKQMDQSKGAAKSRRRRERGGANAYVLEDSTQSLPRAHGAIGLGGVAPLVDAAPESTPGEGDTSGMTWAGLAVDVGDVGEEDEQALEDPSQEFGMYSRLLVEAVRRLRCLDDVERYLLERLQSEVITLSAMHMRTCVGKNEEDAPRSRALNASNSQKSDAPIAHGQRLTPYLNLVFESFTSVLANHMHLVRLLHAARLRDLRESDPGAPVFETDAPYKESLVISLWQHIQTHLMEVLARHIEWDASGDPAAGPGKADTGGRSTSHRARLQSVEPTSVQPTNSSAISRRRGDSPAVGLVSAALDLDHASAGDYCRSCLLATPSPLTIISIFRPTLRFVEVEQVGLS